MTLPEVPTDVRSLARDDYDSPIVLLTTQQDVVRVLARARADFLELAGRYGLTVTPEADRRWWPLAQYRRRT